MKPRAIASLNSLSDRDFFSEISEGCRHVLENSTRFLAAAEALAKDGHGRASHALRLIAEEEGTKYLIMLDAVRCDPQPASRRAKQLKRFNDHLAKGIYAKVYHGRPATVAEVIHYVDMLRASHYLDGPNDTDWVFRNEIAQEREEALYVDFVETDEGKIWWNPGGVRDDEKFSRWFYQSEVLSLIKALDKSGVATVGGLAVVADIWRASPWPLESHYETWRQTGTRTLQALADRGLLAGSDADHARILESWLFPLYDIDMSLIEVSIEELRTRQRQWIWEP